MVPSAAGGQRRGRWEGERGTGGQVWKNNDDTARLDCTIGLDVGGQGSKRMLLYRVKAGGREVNGRSSPSVVGVKGDSQAGEFWKTAAC